MQKIVLSMLLGLSLTSSYAQAQTPGHRRCATVEVEAQRHSRQPLLEKHAAFEKWMAGKQVDRTNSLSGLRGTDETVYTIPVVVHIIHNGETVGNGSNISDVRVQEQIQVLNEDFRRMLGTNGHNTDPRGADINIEFRLAQTDPDDFATNGIVRVRGTATSWSYSDDLALKALSYWPSDKYLNVWVAPLSGGLLGYAQFPESSQLSGISEIGTENALTDGVVVHYEHFGLSGAASFPYNLGRTATHEVGHYLGLRHIWGDNQPDCGDDFCADTPPTKNAFEDCRGGSTPLPSCSSDNPAMVENYMDYTNDACMNIFTADQKNRMRVVMENSPRRLSLRSSPGLAPPPPLINNNAGIQAILSSGSPRICAGSSFVPRVVLQNYGANPLTAVTIAYSLDGGSSQVYNWTGNLASTARVTVALPAINALTAGEHTLVISTSNPNGQADGRTSNDSKTTVFAVVSIQSFSQTANFNLGSLPESWQVINQDNGITWGSWPAYGNGEAGNQAAFLNFYDYFAQGAQDTLVSAPLNTIGKSAIYLKFKVAYADYPSGVTSDGIPYTADDELKVFVSTDCGLTYTPSPVYWKKGPALATTDTASQRWYPKTINHWREEYVDVSSYANQGPLTFAFVGINDFGNDLYLDDIKLDEVPGNPAGTEEDAALNRSLRLYPNPSRGQFTLELDQNLAREAEVEVLDRTGRRVLADNVTYTDTPRSFTLPPSLPNGLYLLRITTKTGTATRRLVVAR